MNEHAPVPGGLRLADLRAGPNALAQHYSRFDVANRLPLTGHSHQAWPDVAIDGQLAAFTDAAAELDGKWDRAADKAEEVRDGYRALLGDPDGELALGASTHELLVRFLSGLDLCGRRRLVTTDGEFHTVRRQLDRLAEAGVEVVRVPAEPADTLAERLAAEVDGRAAAVLVSAVLFETARIVPGLDGLAESCARWDAELLVDAYHALGVVGMPIHEQGLGAAWIVGGGYKYLQLGEGNCFLRLPRHADRFRPVVTGWFSEFSARSQRPGAGEVAYGSGAARFAGATYDPTSHYRAASVFEFFRAQGLTPAFLREVSLHQNSVLADAFDELALPPELVTRDRTRPRSDYAGFLALRCAEASAVRASLARYGVYTDHRGDYLRFGPAPYLSDRQLRDAMAALGEVLRVGRGTGGVTLPKSRGNG
ncbi:Selenocysteine lyase/Cysteine desulfurase [Haloechinothrix alba]|uniref:Selenocysteine lyase/Cysteine desulfurase n=1 Tax=Haloechinothrix alba TaxID=664784 RepID=A0A238X0B1_9PSEU|nr:kynureninase [Haloechinothrix alba]SNR52296.1 Selenocysteine lyase/Cysteine desulfurase [Haloechinothrix alba]